MNVTVSSPISRDLIENNANLVKFDGFLLKCTNSKHCKFSGKSSQTPNPFGGKTIQINKREGRRLYYHGIKYEMTMAFPLEYYEKENYTPRT